jgi:hypothetical protein
VRHQASRLLTGDDKGKEDRRDLQHCYKTEKDRLVWGLSLEFFYEGANRSMVVCLPTADCLLPMIGVRSTGGTEFLSRYCYYGTVKIVGNRTFM